MMIKNKLYMVLIWEMDTSPLQKKIDIDIRINELQKELELLQSEVRYLKYCWDLKSIMDQEDNNKNQM